MNTNKPGRLSVCLLGYNHGPFIADNIKALWQCKWPDMEIIAVDDGSHDDSRQILRDLADKSPVPMQLVLQENTGNIAKNFNTAVSRASGEFLLFMALDDRPNPAGLEQALTLLHEQPDTAFVLADRMPMINLHGKANGEFACNLPKELTAAAMLEKEYENLHTFFIQNAVFRKTAVDAVGGFDEDMTGDDIVLRTKLFRLLETHPGLHFKTVTEPIAFYRLHGSNIHYNGLRQIKTATEYLTRYWPDRPNPPALIHWAQDLLKNEPYKKAFEMFALNARAASLASDKEVQKSLVRKIRQEHSPWRFIYKKERHYTQRTVTLFSFLRFTYNYKR